MSKNVGIFVPARLSSQRLKNKQLYTFETTCMFEIACQKLAYIKTKYDINTYVLICEPELMLIAEKYPDVTIIKRDPDTVVQEGPLRYIYKDVLNVPEDYLMFLNPCLIFLTPDTIMDSIKQFQNSPLSYATSVKKFQNWLWNSVGMNITDINYERLTTKEISPLYEAANGFHIFDKNAFVEDGLMLTDKLMLIEIPEDEAIDIDTYDDYLYAKWLYEVYGRR